jgi:hypothetical protein
MGNFLSLAGARTFAGRGQRGGACVVGSVQRAIEDKDRDEVEAAIAMIEYIDIIRSCFLFILGHTHILSLFTYV